ncbi:hypothetical protein FNV43_RR23315 [Rhamnella rubrinervis]|uniref:Uncharacterized protein n=1 Tax=Rhamnella rubrinervis TaxID=2594499 RepID=A0A8K0DVX7_9ROSA|nr:hypothetical protein FNV43_RR23315 [Rhamnella rubrinervis]
MMSMHMQRHHEAEGRVLGVEMNMRKKVEEQASLLWSSLQKGGKPPAPNPSTQASNTISQRDFAGRNANAAYPPPPPPPRPTAHSDTMQLLFSMAATVTAAAS